MNQDNSALQEKQEHKYKDTIDLPQTDFPMRGNGPTREPEIQALWFKENIYQKALKLREKHGAESFILHDGPPYLSSDKIHIGTALNKILKDIVIKYKSQRGYKTPYVPGYDSHGLPIENAVVKDLKGGRSSVTVAELRERCANFALTNLKGQEEKFKRLGVLGEWEKPYVTLDKKFESEQIKLFAEMAEKGHIYRGLKTVQWSWGAETALAEAEVEYKDDHQSPTIYVALKIITTNFSNAKDASLIIWTTTPWTIPGNLGVCLSKDIDYAIYQTEKFGKIIIAKELEASFIKETEIELTQIGDVFKGKELADSVAKHPLFNRESKVIFGSHVTTEAGTGCVHTAPGHGQEDFLVGKEYALEILCPVNEKGVYTKDALSYKFNNVEFLNKALEKNQSLKQKLENRNQDLNQEIELEGFHVLKQANDLIVAALFDANALLKLGKITHSYPYCWRSKTPLIYRATEQWFASIDGFRKEALSEIEKVQWIPERGKNRIYKMVEDRGDWCISRQRTWGVPIPAIYNQAKINSDGNPEAILDQEIIAHVAKIFENEGTTAWYTRDKQDLIPKSFFEKNPEIKIENIKLETDTMDVWFDSGSTHRSVVAVREELTAKDSTFKAVDLYLEGSDQHRGWFQSSLLTSVATNGFAPYKAVLTHGFVMDEKGRKMSKSLGNVVDPADVIAKYGADILRLWVASVDYSIDIKVGDTMFKQLSDIYRNFRNTSRYLLGNLFDFNPTQNKVRYDELWQIDKLILHKLENLKETLTENFDNYHFFKYYQVIQNFCSVELSAFYFDIVKDRLYTHGKNSKSRRAAQSVLYELLNNLNRLFVPVLPHLSEDIFNYTSAEIKNSYKETDFFIDGHEDASSILLSNWPSIIEANKNKELEIFWEEILNLRELAYKEVEQLRQEKKIGKSLEAKLVIKGPKEKLDKLEAIVNELKQVFIVSQIEFQEHDAGFAIEAQAFDAEKCFRCWKLFEKKEMKEDICETCHNAISPIIN
jgi:isoleucyl-tRNA synthetase